MASEKEVKDASIKEKVIDVQDGDSLLQNKKEKRVSSAYLFGKAFGEKLRTDKLFLLSFFVTLVFLCFLCYKTLRDSKSSYPGFINNIIPSKEETKKDDNSNVIVDETLDIRDYVGIYSRDVELASNVVLSDTCSFKDYKYIYQIKKDKTINKFLYNDCLGVIKVWSDKLDYVSSGGTKYIGTQSIHFLFSGTSMKEVDGDTYRLDENISTLKENVLINNLKVYIKDNNVVFMNSNKLIIMKNSSVLFDYNTLGNNGGNLNRLVYRIDENNYKFIVFSNKENMNCYDKDSSLDVVYKIYAITYDKEKQAFNDPKELVSRTHNDGCANWKDDLALLEE